MEDEKKPHSHTHTLANAQIQVENVQSVCGLAGKRPKPTENLMCVSVCVCARGNRIFRTGSQKEKGKVNESVKSYGNQ